MGVLRLKGRYYRQVPQAKAGYEEELLELDPAKTSFIAMHCWDIGFAENPADGNYSVGMGYMRNLEESARIVKEVIIPAVKVCREAGILVSHVENDPIVNKHRPPAQSAAPPAAEPLPPVVPGWRESITYGRAHGDNYPSKGPYSRMDRIRDLYPEGDEPFVAAGDELDPLLRARGIENLVYTGFAADMCILRSPGGTQDMFNRGYRVFLIREGTLGVEFPDSFEERRATWWGIRYFESKVGDTVSYEEFMAECRKLIKGQEGR